MLWLPVVLALAPPTLSPGGGSDATGELGILDEFLAVNDTTATLGEHCLRHGGVTQTPADVPRPPLEPPVASGTNLYLKHHNEWHWAHIRLMEQADGRDDANAYGTDFVMFHRHMIAEYDAWRVARGRGLLALWDPSTPIPAAFAYDVPPPCFARKTDDPRVHAPSWTTVAGGLEKDPLWNYTSLCDFPDLNRLGKSVDSGFHGRVHSRVGGDMTVPEVSPRDPVFAAWHKWLDVNVFQAWERACGPGRTASTASAAVAAPREIPGLDVAALVASAAVVAAATRRR